MCSSTSTAPTSPAAPKEGIDFDALPWNLNLPDGHSYVHLTTTTDWSANKDYLKKLDNSVYSYSKVPLDIRPASTSINYGTTVWEGLKCYRTASGQLAVFRPDRNYERMKNGAAELCLPMPSKELFLAAIQVAIQRNAELVPPSGEGMKLYVRPMLLGTGQQLGLYPSPEFSFVVYVSPTGNYFKSATSGLNLHLETRRARAAVGGMGACKCSGNYAAALKPLMDCKKHGFMDNVFLELETFQNGNLKQAILQEMSAANVFLVLKTGEIVTPDLARGTILPGVTRESVLALIETYADELKEAMKESLGCTNDDGDSITVKASSRDVTVAEMEDAVEAFCTGTAAELVPIGNISTSPDDTAQFAVEFPHGTKLPGGPVTVKLLQMLREAMVGDRPMPGWIRDPFASTEEFCK